MRAVFSVLFGALAGLIVAPVTIYLVGPTIMSETARAIVGVGVGGFFGAVIGSIGGDISRQADAQGSRAVIGFLAGAIAGVLAALEYQSISNFFTVAVNKLV